MQTQEKSPSNRDKLKIYNSLSRSKETFKSIHENRVGMYVCGPTVYSDVHLGNCRTFTGFDLIYRYLTHLGYKVRYVRNITDVGHLENDEDMTGEDKIAKKARLEQIEPMEIVQRYTKGFHKVMAQLNNNPPSIEPSATGHIIEQIEMVQKILDNGYAYERNGSVYFKTVQFAEKHEEYGQISGKKLDDLRVETRDLKAQSEKDHPSDFAIWMNANESHIMRWNSPWGIGFPGWHLECSAMSTKYLGEHFDIHGGGLDLQFPHHENEVAQNIGCCGTAPANYWLHTNMLTFEGTKMSKSLGNSILPDELFTGEHDLLSQAYSPMTLRFFFLRTHYRSVCDFSDKGLKDAEKGFQRLMAANKALQDLEYIGKEKIKDEDKIINGLIEDMSTHMNDDFNTPRVLATMFELVAKVNAFKNRQLKINSISKITLERLQTTFKSFIEDVFGLQVEEANNDEVMDNVLNILIEMRKAARANKDWAMSDKIRDELMAAGIQLKDGKDGTSWSLV
ncbi:MAG: cysteine--tRNA ligase [Saprospiraceae bacterium]